MNAVNMLRVADIIEQEAGCMYNQDRYHHACGTPACIAGHAVAVLIAEDMGAVWDDSSVGIKLRSMGENEIAHDAASFLDLNDWQAKHLFKPYPLEEHGMDVTNTMAAYVVRYAAMTEIVDWTIIKRMNGDTE